MISFIIYLNLSVKFWTDSVAPFLQLSSFDFKANIEFDDFKFCLSASYKSSYEFICRYLIAFSAKQVILFAIIKSSSKLGCEHLDFALFTVLMKSSIPMSSCPLIPRIFPIAVFALILSFSMMCGAEGTGNHTKGCVLMFSFLSRKFSCACLASRSSSDEESLVTSRRCVVSLSVSTSPEQPTFTARLEISSILLSFSLLSILKERVRDSIWASIRPNSSSVVCGGGDLARMGE